MKKLLAVSGLILLLLSGFTALFIVLIHKEPPIVQRPQVAVQPVYAEEQKNGLLVQVDYKKPQAVAVESIQNSNLVPQLPLPQQRVTSSIEIDFAKKSVVSNIMGGNSENVIVNLMARVINAEADDQPVDGKIAVGDVILKRMHDTGDSIFGVVYAVNQFDGVSTYRFFQSPSNEDYYAAEQAFKGVVTVPDAYYFVNLKLVPKPDWAQDSKLVKRIGDHWFYTK